jgi:pimeloyl-ACP methyl ester carboxylesterase
MSWIEAGGHRLEYQWFGSGDANAPALVLLHEGLGSVAAWRDFPEVLARETGLRVLAYSRWGYGKSEPIRTFPHGPDYMHREALQALPDVLRRLQVDKPILLGHSDGASIALIYAANRIAPAPLGVIAIAPHVFIERISTISIARARLAYEESDLRERIAKFHDDVDSAFYGWNTTWLLPPLAHWNIEHEIERIRCPITVIQGEGDEYGTPKQLESIKRHSGGKAELVLLPDCGHSPHREQRAATLAAIARHIAALEVAA